MGTKLDYYHVLGLKKDASVEDVKRAYRKAAMQYHPDRRPDDPEAERKFKNASEAYQVLADPEKRRLYDMYGHEGLDRSGFHGFSNVEDIFSSFGDLFSDFFGGSPFGDAGRRRGERRGRSLSVMVELDLREAARGVTREVQYARHEVCGVCKGTGGKGGAAPQACPYCRGEGRVIQSSGFFRVATTCPRCGGAGAVIADPCRECGGTGLRQVRRKIEVKVPAGVETGQQMRIRGEGSFGENGAPAGDLYVEISVREHDLFKRHGQDLVFDMPVSFAQAALGDEVEVPTIWGKASLRIPPGTQSGTPIYLRGEGLPDIHSERRGDQVVIIHVETPRKLTARQKELLEEFAKSEDMKVTPQRRTWLEKVREYFEEGKNG